MCLLWVGFCLVGFVCLFWSWCLVGEVGLVCSWVLCFDFLLLLRCLFVCGFGFVCCGFGFVCFVFVCFGLFIWWLVGF